MSEREGEACANSIFAFPALQCPLEVRDVERINQYPLYELGKAIRHLTVTINLKEVSARTAYSPIITCLTTINGLLAGNPFPLGISKKVAEELRSNLQSVFDEYFRKKDDNGKEVIRLPDPKVMIESWEWSHIRSIILRFETSLFNRNERIGHLFCAETSALCRPAAQSSSEGLQVGRVWLTGRRPVDVALQMACLCLFYGVIDLYELAGN